MQEAGLLCFATLRLSQSVPPFRFTDLIPLAVPLSGLKLKGTGVFS